MSSQGSMDSDHLGKLQQGMKDSSWWKVGLGPHGEKSGLGALEGTNLKGPIKPDVLWRLR